MTFVHSAWFGMIANLVIFLFSTAWFFDLGKKVTEVRDGTFNGLVLRWRLYTIGALFVLSMTAMVQTSAGGLALFAFVLGGFAAGAIGVYAFFLKAIKNRIDAG